MTDCKACTFEQPSGHYNMRCVQCCARLVVSARPSRVRQEAMLEVARRTPGAPIKQEIINAVKMFIADNKKD